MFLNYFYLLLCVLKKCHLRLVFAFKSLCKFVPCILRQLCQIWPCPKSSPTCRNCEDIFYTKLFIDFFRWPWLTHRFIFSLYETGDMKNNEFYWPFSRWLISLTQSSEPSCLFLLIKKNHSALLRLSIHK